MNPEPVNAYGYGNMKTHTRIALFILVVLLASFAVLTMAAVETISEGGRERIEAYRDEELRKIKRNLKNQVDTAYGIIEGNMRNAQDPVFLQKYYGRRLKDILGLVETVLKDFSFKVSEKKLSLKDAKAGAITILSKMRYGEGADYIWINDMGRPYPKMIMHPTSPELNGKVLDDDRFNRASGRSRNLFQVAVDLCREMGEGFIDYSWPKKLKTGDVREVAKLSYVRLFSEWGWVLGTGVFVDDAVEDAKARSLADIKKMRYDKGTGYFWVNDTGRPYPKMLMHPLQPELDGRILDDPKFRLKEQGGKNLFNAMVDIGLERGGGFLSYRWAQKTGDEMIYNVPKLSGFRLYEPLGWVVGTGMYTDFLDLEIEGEKRALLKRIRGLKEKALSISALVLLVSLTVTWFFGKYLFRPKEK